MNCQLICDETKSLKMVRKEVPEAPKEGLVIKVEFSGICHSDAHIYGEDHYKILLKKILGHEVSGTVYKVGENIKQGELKVGDKVVLYAWGGCLNCELCTHNELCTNRNGPHAHVYGVWRDGGFQKYVEVENVWNVLPVPDGIPLEVACLVPCSGITAFNALENCKDSIARAIANKGHANLLVMGAGGLGSWLIEFAKAIFSDKVKVVAADINENKLLTAKQTGADNTVLIIKTDEAKEVMSKILSAFDGSGVDAAVDLVNSPTTVTQILSSLTNNATLVMVGITTATFPPVRMDQIYLKSIRLQGIYAGSKKQVSQVFKMLQADEVKGPQVCKVALNDVQQVLDNMLAGSFNDSRAIVDMN